MHSDLQTMVARRGEVRLWTSAPLNPSLTHLKPRNRRAANQQGASPPSSTYPLPPCNPPNVYRSPSADVESRPPRLVSCASWKRRSRMHGIWTRKEMMMSDESHQAT